MRSLFGGRAGTVSLMNGLASATGTLLVQYSFPLMPKPEAWVMLKAGRGLRSRISPSNDT
jgi:hypothetical protein